MTLTSEWSWRFVVDGMMQPALIFKFPLGVESQDSGKRQVFDRGRVNVLMYLISRWFLVCDPLDITFVAHRQACV